MTDPSEAIARALARFRELPESERTAVVESLSSQSVHSEDEIRSRLDAGDSDDFLSPGGPLGGVLGEHLAAAVDQLAPANDLTGETVGDVRIVRVLGDGGFGRVYLGRDDRLERDVAVKVLRSSQRYRDEARERLRREARLLSKLDHPNICRIYGLEEEGDDDCLLLEYIDGERLTEAAEGKDLDARLQLARQVADALAAAHGEGIIHRDLKPDNVLVTGSGVVKVLDLGVARLAEDPVLAAPSGAPSSAAGSGSGSADLTRLGSKLGTIRYMSPEQARGEPVTTASDVFALGLLFYELFDRGPAYAGATDAELVERIQRGGVEPFGHADPELSALVAGLLAPEPVMRPSAAVVRGAIDALLDRPRQRRRRALRRWAAAAIVIVALVTLLGWLQLRRQAARDVAVAEELLSEVKDIEWRMRAEYLSPRHDITPALDEIRERIDGLAGRIEELGHRATGRGRYALGRAAVSVGDLESARGNLEAAWESGHRTPEVALTLGQVLADTFRNEVDLAFLSVKPEKLESEIARLRDELGAPAASFLELAREARVGPPRYVEALLAVSEMDYERGLTALEEIELPWFYEAQLLEGWIQMRLAWKEMVGGSPERLRDALSRADRAYSRAIEIGRSDPAGYLGRCDVAGYELQRGRLSPEEAIVRGDSAVETCSLALAVTPGSVRARAALATVHYAQAEVASNQGRDPRSLLAEAAAVIEEGLAHEPDASQLQRSLLDVLTLQASSELLNGEDPEPTYERGRQVADSLLAHEDLPASSMAPAVFLLLNHGYYLASQGRSPVEVIERAIEIGKRVVEVDPDNIHLANLAGCYFVLALYQVDHGLEPLATLREGVAMAQRSLDALPGQLIPLRILGLLHDLHHYHLSRVGGDVETPLVAARATFREALEIDPDFIWARIGWIDLELTRAEWLIDNGRSPAEELRRTDELLEPMTGSEDFVESSRLLYAGEAAYLEGRWLASQGRSPAALYRRGEELLRRGLAMRQNEPNLFAGLAEVLFLRARWEIDRGAGGATATVREGLAVIDEVLSATPNHAGSHELRARLLGLLAELSGEGRSEASAEASEALARACEINRFLPACAESSSVDGLPSSVKSSS